jgi:phosphoribosylanthranilate isomerase
MTWIKICGMTNLDDALAAVEAGADALGFVFAESARTIAPETAAEITRHLPPNIGKIGVFVAETPKRIEAIADQVGLTAVQLHQTAAIPDVKHHRAIPVLHMSEIEACDYDVPITFVESVDTVLLDSGTAQKGGGTGRPFNWERAATFLQTIRLSEHYRIIVAGGLTPENVGDAIQLFHPFGVDVVSGVEREKGKKDHDKVRAFVAAVRAADAIAQEASKAKTCQ